MPDQIPPTEHANRSDAAIRAGASLDSSESWDNEGGHMSSRFGRIVRYPGAEQPYKVILSHDVGTESERAFGTMREAEAFIRRNTPRPRPRSTFWDRDAPEG
jgi:hypothetical protein